MKEVELHIYEEFGEHAKNNKGTTIAEIKYAVVIKITENTSIYIKEFDILIISKRKDALKKWINDNAK